MVVSLLGDDEDYWVLAFFSDPPGDGNFRLCGKSFGGFRGFRGFRLLDVEIDGLDDERTLEPNWTVLSLQSIVGLVYSSHGMPRIIE